MKPLVETRSSVFKAVLLSFVLGMSAGVINFFSALSAEFKIEQQRQSEISDLNFERIVALAKSSNGTVAELEKFARTATVLRPSLVSLDISVRGQSLVNWERPRQTSSRPILDALTERWITYERMDAGTGVYLRGVKDSHIAYRYFVDRQWVNARTALLRTLLVMAIVWACVYLFLAKPLREVRAQIKSPNFTDKGLKLKSEVGAEFLELAEGINEVLARDQLLRKRNQRLFLALMQTKDACFIYTAKDGKAIFINHAGMAIVGGKREDRIGQPIYEMVANTNEDTYRESQLLLAKQDSIRQVRKIVSPEGETRYFQVTTSKAVIDEEQINVMLVHDLSDPRNAVRQFQLDDLKRLVGNIAHEMNNSHQVIAGRIEIAKEETGTASAATESLNKAQSEIDEASGLIQRLMTYAQVTQVKPVKFKVVDAVNFIVQEQQALAKQYDISSSLTGLTPEQPAFMDEASFYAIVRELISNAVEASEPGTLILISTEHQCLEESILVMQQVVPPGQYVRVSVSDQGRGMSASEIDTAFDPFHSATNQVGRGLGLSTVQSSIEVAGGAIDIESAPGIGTKVSILVPVPT
ncbi:MAG: ATP-binding protein [Pseudomonadales bacterium]